ncbi:hypothetical protein HLB44_31970 [Aquincola sp. S2]|uniref:DUF3300 domain-containing protein n=1 Tax=Pseudaquabacterium terrae TaxID=2732868 RepID=A0ABX2ESE2_9BURK|nr:hypothetical protein [Aquabacterium terrae]NRF71615.1 hypothetical protein [Aquabacterium terrae]
MSRRPLAVRLVLAALGALTVWASAVPAAHAQSLFQIAAANQAFDQQQASMLANMQRQNANAQQQLWQQHLRVNGPRLQQQYRQLLASGNRQFTFEQFAYWDLMTAAGTNVQGALAAQRAQFEGNQAAHRTVQQGHDSYNAGWRNNSARQSAAVANYSNQAIRGVGPYVDSQTGATQMLPHSLPAGQVYRDGQNNAYAQDAQGVYHRWAGNGWVRLDAAR